MKTIEYKGLLLQDEIITDYFGIKRNSLSIKDGNTIFPIMGILKLTNFSYEANIMNQVVEYDDNDYKKMIDKFLIKRKIN